MRRTTIFVLDPLTREICEADLTPAERRELRAITDDYNEPDLDEDFAELARLSLCR